MMKGYIVKKFLLSIFLFFVAVTSAYSQTNSCDELDVPGLSEKQVIELKQSCIKLKSTEAPVSVQELGEYAELGKKYGIALSEVAKSVGTTVNELAFTPVGKFLLVLVAWKVIGQDLVGLGVGFTWFVVMIPLWVYMFHRFVFANRTDITDYYEDEKLKRRVYGQYKEEAYTVAFFMVVILGAICISGFVILF